MKSVLILLQLLAALATCQKCGSSLKPEKLVVVGVWKRSFDNSTAQYRISDEDLSVRGYERANADKASSTVMLARHPEGCVLDDCGVRLTAMMQVNGAILHTDHRNVKLNDSTMDNIEDEFYCAGSNNSCGADVPIYRLVKHSLTGPHYAYSFDNVGQSLPGYEKEYFPLCFAWRQTPSVVLFNSSDDAVCLTLPETSHGRIIYSNNQINVYSIGTTATLHCDHGYASDGDSTLMCTKDGWHPKGGLGHCEEQKKKVQLLVAAEPIQDVGCQIPTTTANGNVVYSANVASSTSKTTVPSATRATVLCNLGFVPSNSAPSSKCVDGQWEPSLPSCVSLLDLKCPILSAPRNGELIFPNSSPSPYNLDSVIALKCDRNFFGTGNLTARCTSTGWDQRIGRCEPVGIRKLSPSIRNRYRRQVSTGVACTALATPSSGNILYMQSNPSVEYSSGTSGYLMCNLGYSLSGSVSSLCTNGVWAPALGQCTNALQLGQTTGNCDAITTRTNGSISYTSLGTYPSGTIATLTCNLMNTASGSTTSTCLSGVWNPTLGQCVYSATGTGGTGSTSTCTNPTVVNGVITYSQGNTFDITRPYLTTATLTCNSGFTLSGNPLATCTGGVFTPTLGTCNLGGSSSSTCTILIVMNGQITYTQGNTYDITRPAMTVATLACNSGYSLSGNSQSTCTNGVFTPTLGTCNLGGTGGTGTGTTGTCPNPTVINGNITYSQGSALDFTRPYLTTATLLCNSGYTLSGNSFATCTGGTFTPTLGTCTFGSSSTTTTCTNPIVVNGVITYNQGNTYDLTRPAFTVATLACNSGYSLSGNSQATCTNGSFSPALGTCNFGSSTSTGTACSNPIVMNGVVTYSQGNTYDLTRPSLTVATLTCNSGYTLNGNSRATCTNGVFTPTLGTCNFGTSSSTGTTCTNPIVMGGVITYSLGNTYDLTRPASTVATLSCSSGYTLNGNSQSTCTNGVFTPTLGTCNFGSTGSTGTTCMNPIVMNGVLTYNQGNTFDLTRPASTVVTLACNSGYSLSGNSQSTCTNGVFTPTLGTCNLGGTGGTGTGTTCPNPIAINGVLTYSQGNTFDTTRPALTVATLACNFGYSLSGNSQATCTNGVFTPTLGTCNFGSSGSTGTLQCTAMIAPLGGNVTYSNGGQMGPFPAGTTVTGTCTTGSIVGASSASCQNGMWSPTFLGTCSLIGGTTTGQCSALTVPTGAQATYSPFSLSTTSFTSGTVATVTCTVGGTLLGTSTCTNGIWSPSITQTCGSGTGGVGTCSALTRPVGETVTYDGQTSFSTSFSTGTIARVTCTNGTQLGQSTCSLGTWSPAITTTCSGSSTAVGTQCIGVIVPTNSQVTYSDGSMVLHSSGTTATLSCLNGASMTGNSFSSCSNGVWTPTLGTCTTAGGSTNPCYTPPLTPTGATITYSSGYFAPWTSGSTATMSCPAGQTVVGNTISYCTNAAWSPAFGTCSGSTSGIGQGCTPLSAFQGTLTNGRMEYSPTITTRVPVGTIVNVVCFSGYSLVGNSFASCSSSGWSPSAIGSCVQQAPAANQCVAMSTPTYGTLSYSVSGLGPFPSGTTVTLRCDTNYAVASGGVSSATCLSGVWSPSSLATCQRALREVIPASCPLGIAPVLAATMVYSNESPIGPYPPATVVTATCQTGYVPNGLMTALCENGVWTPATLGTCELLGNEIGGTSCGRLGDVLSGTLVYSALGLGPYPSGTSVTVLCNIGATLSGAPSAICTNGVWNPLPGACVNTLLRKPPLKTNNITVAADDSPVGNKTEVVEKSPAKVALSGETCPPPMAPAFGEITFSGLSTKGAFEDGTTAALKCNLGYKSSGPSFSTCRKGSFRPIIGKCRNDNNNQAVCVPLAPPKNSRIVYIQTGSSLDFEDGTTALLYCEEGFAVTGVATLQCQSGQWEPAAGFGMCDSI